MAELSAEAEALWRAVELANTGRAAGERVHQLLEQLAAAAPEGSEAWVYAHRELAALVRPKDPWRASVCARRALAHAPTDAMAWGVLALCQTALGNHAFALRAYRKALALDPDNPWYAHNLGHFLDVLHDRSEEGAQLITHALQALTEWPQASRRHRVEMTASLAHALMRTGHVAAAHAHMRDVVGSGLATRAHHDLYGAIRRRLEATLAEEMERLDVGVREAASVSDRRVRKRRRVSGLRAGDACATDEGDQPTD
jgi:cytochrome c-type biogenesis protein CcmH/NrfG